MRLRTLVLRATLALLGVAALSAAAPAHLAPSAALAKDKEKEKLQITPGEKKDGVEVLDCAPKGRALLYVPAGIDAAKKPGLFVTLHGHGSTAENMLLREFAERRKWATVSVQGRGDVQTPQGPGHQWDGADAPYIAAVAKWCVQNRGIDPASVVVFGHSAGGTMALLAYAADPSVFTGVVTCSAPEVPGKAQETARVVVFLGTQDPNFSNAAPLEGRLKKESGHLALTVVDGAEHNDLPATPYLDLALDWALAKNAAGGEVKLPKAPPTEPAAGFRHVLFRYKGAAGAPADVKRAKDGAKAAADDLLKRVRAGKALLSREAQAVSEDAESRPLGGAIDADRLAAFGGALAGVKDAPPGADRWSGPLESPAGFHVVERAP
jgi:poly(3-hydroxybutyrate) depolymerase